MVVGVAGGGNMMRVGGGEVDSFNPNLHFLHSFMSMLDKNLNHHKMFETNFPFTNIKLEFICDNYSTEIGPKILSQKTKICFFCKSLFV